jgi:NADPH-dependent curcumin reductase CurA
MPSEIPAYSLPNVNRQVLLARRPNGVPRRDDFKLETAPLPGLAAGEMRVRNIYLSVDPAQRGWASSESNYSSPVAIGDPMRSLAVGVVVESFCAEYAEGDFLYGWFGWQDYAIATPDRVIFRAKQDVPLTAVGSLLGINGVTAYLALNELGRPRPGDTLLVSTAAGSVGSFVGQIGRNLGCRAIGLTGDESKIAACAERYGYHEAINYKNPGLTEAIQRAAPEGVNVYFDNTGGAILDIALRQMAVGGQCGTASIASWTPPPTGPRNEREILTRRLVLSGFVVFDHLPRYAAAVDELASLYNARSIVYDVDVAEGIEQAPGAISALYDGSNRGKKLIYVG